MEKIELVDLKAQYRTIKPEIDAAIQDVLDNTAFIMGKNVSNFEKEFSAYCNAAYCVCVSNGTVALELALRASGIGPGDEVITVPNTFIATTEVITAVGASIKFVDIDPKTYLMDTSKIVVSSKTKAIIPVHLYGQPVDMDPLFEIARKHNLVIIEDCAQAHGAEYKGKRVPIAGIGCFSFYPGKNLGAYGDAGAIVTNDKNVYEKVRMIADHGRKPGDKYLHTIEGGNYRIDALQARILSVKLKHLDDWTEARRKHANQYKKLLKGIILPFESPNAKHVNHLFVIETAHRDALKEHLTAQGINTGIHYPVPLHEQPAYAYLGLKTGSFPVTESKAKRILSLPMYPELSQEQILRVAEAVNSFQRQ